MQHLQHSAAAAKAALLQVREEKVPCVGLFCLVNCARNDKWREVFCRHLVVGASGAVMSV